MSKKIVLETDKVVLEKEERFNHRTTPEITWYVLYKPTGLYVSSTKTKKDALAYFNIYNQGA